MRALRTVVAAIATMGLNGTEQKKRVAAGPVGNKMGHRGPGKVLANE